MQKIFWFAKLSILGVLLPTTFGLTAQSVKSETVNSDSLVNSQLIVAEGYHVPAPNGDFLGTSYHYESIGDEYFQSASYLYQIGNYLQAINEFRIAGSNYVQCLNIVGENSEIGQRVKNRLAQVDNFIQEAQSFVQRVR